MGTARPGMRWAAAAIMCLALSGAVEAQEIRGLYVGVGAGIFNYENENNGISDGAGIYRIVGGYQLNSNYAIEAGWVQGEDVKEQFFTVNPMGEVVPVNVAVESEIKTLRVLAFAPFSGLGMFGSVGYFDADFTTGFSIVDPLNPRSGVLEQQSDSGVTVAGGIQYEWSRIALRGEYEWFDTDDIDATALNLIAVFRF
jgi:Outer membrane protein beta-barrel domain